MEQSNSVGNRSAEIKEALQESFGFSQFRGEQEAIIQHVLAGQSGLVVMSTGFGKSLCYQLPALLFQQSKGSSEKGLVLVFSPLIALMEDQVQAAQKKGVWARAIHSGMARRAKDQVMEELRQGQVSLLYVTPERFRKEEFRDAIASQRIRLLAVDEAHCMSLWGHDFRPDYSKLGVIRKRLGNPPTLALTATATHRVQEDILSQLNLNLKLGGVKRFLGGIERPELALHVHDLFGLENKVDQIVKLRERLQGSLLVYWSLIGTLEKAAVLLRRKGLRLGKYHGQMEASERSRSQQQFFDQNNGILLATPAFGLGVDKADIRGVIHGELPASLESYYQEVGRAGRDRQPAEGHLLFDEDDVSIAMDFIKWSCPEPSFVQNVYHLIKERSDEYRAEGADFLRQQLNFYNSRDFRVETSLNQLERAGKIQWTGQFYEIVADIAPEELVRGVDPEELVRGADPEELVSDVAPEELAREASPEELASEVNDPLVASFFSPVLHQKHFKSQNEKLLAILRWAQQSEGCRMVTIYQYFDHPHPVPCGVCDLCCGGGGK